MNCCPQNADNTVCLLSLHRTVPRGVEVGWSEEVGKHFWLRGYNMDVGSTVKLYAEEPEQDKARVNL